MKSARRIIEVVLVIALVGATALWGPKLVQRLRPAPDTEAQKAAVAKPSAKLAVGIAEALELPADVIRQMGVTTSVALADSTPVPLQMSGTLTLDPEKYAGIRSRFDGEVVELPQPEGASRSVSVGDPVKQGELLAVIWSRELGEKKSELVDALSQQHHDTAELERLRPLAKEGAVAGRTILDLERVVEGDRIAVDRASRTLSVLRIQPAEIEEVRKEAANIIAGKPTPHEDLISSWARIEVRAPFDGVVLERDVAPGQLVESNDDLFKIGNLSRLRVVAYAYEEDLPRLDRLTQTARNWTISVPASPDMSVQSGAFDRIGNIIDPNQHTALVMGWVDNPQQQLRAGQFIKAVIQIRPPPGQLRLPASALVERKNQTLVLAQPDPSRPVFQLRRVELVRREPGSVLLRTDAKRGVVAGEYVVTTGTVELLAALDELQAASAATRIPSPSPVPSAAPSAKPSPATSAATSGSEGEKLP